MCGIAGIATTAGERIESSAIHRMCQAIVYRGPDDEGIFVKDGVGLGMRRLSIIDLAGGHQPVFNEDRSICVVYNGEIYNFTELRSDLLKRGHHLATHSDTEVIVHLYEEKGSDCVRELRGMFAFALWDARRNKLLLARDRIGEKPLYYAFDGSRFLFASEIKAIHAIAPHLVQLDRPAIRRYLQFGYVPDPATAYSSIKKLPPAHLLELEAGKVAVSQYWELPEYGTYQSSSEQECLEELEDRLAEAVRMRLIADVPLGVLLSGGSDSSTIVALMARFSSRPVKTFTIGFRHQDFDETSHARLVAQKFETEHHDLIIEPNVVSSLQTITGSLEEPFADASALPTYYVSCLARQHVTVALSGDGGDEIFAGYERYRVCLQDRALPWLPDWIRRVYRDHIYQFVPRSVPGRSLSYSISLPLLERYLEDISFQPVHREMRLFSEDFMAAGGEETDPFQVFRDHVEKAPARDPLSRLLYLDSKTYLPADILTKVDRMSMLTSLEARAPMVDHVFVEWVTRLPFDWKMRGSYQKYLLKKLAERLGVPKEVLHRPKQGFALPLVHWTRHELKEMIQTLLLEPRTLQRGYFNPTAVHQLLDEHFRQRRNHAGRIWRILALELWHRNYLEKLNASELPGLPEMSVSLNGGAS
jgi:asparagine synthase (glutamine-hydrolysing)